MICSICGKNGKNTYKRHKFNSEILCAKHNAQMEKHGQITQTYKDLNKIIQYESYSGIILTNKLNIFKGEALVSNDMLELVAHKKWHMSCGYARSGWHKNIFMHHALFGKPPRGFFIDHINGNKLDNRKENIRIVTKSQNSMNSKVFSNNPYKVKGVSFDKYKNKYRAYIKVRQKQIFLGYFENINDAVHARLIAEERYFEEYKKGWQLAEAQNNEP